MRPGAQPNCERAGEAPRVLAAPMLLRVADEVAQETDSYRDEGRGYWGLS
jgi:hypothetical protein